jgi:ribose-phosphate pyrophosphokinase
MPQPPDEAIVLGFPDYAAPARRLAERAGLAYADVEVHAFPDGESLVRLPERLPARVVLCRSLDHPNDKLVELELAAATARELGARRLDLVAPYLCYMRQDIAFQPGQSVSQRIIGAWLARHFDTLVTVDPHLHRTRELHDAIPVRRAVALSAAPALAAWLAERGDRPLLLGPDEESAQWVAKAASAGGLEHAVARKHRFGDREVRVDLPDRRFEGRHVVLVDDVASTGQTLIETARRLRERAPASVSVLVTHALFVGDAIERLRVAGVDRVCSSDSVPHASNRVHLDALLAGALHEV